jgi:hypothetical protein
MLPHPPGSCAILVVAGAAASPTDRWGDNAHGHGKFVEIHDQDLNFSDLGNRRSEEIYDGISGKGELMESV